MSKTSDAATQTDDAVDRAGEALRVTVLHLAAFWKAAKARVVDRLAPLAHPLMTGPIAIELYNMHLVVGVPADADDNSLAESMLEDIEMQHLIPDITLADARCDVCAHRYFPLRADSPVVFGVPVYSPPYLPVEGLGHATLRNLTPIIELCGAPTAEGRMPCQRCMRFWVDRRVHRGSGPLQHFKVDARMQGEWLKERWPIDIGFGERVLATVCRRCILTHQTRGVVRAAVPADVLKSLRPDIDTHHEDGEVWELGNVWFRARRMTADGVAALL